ncbi:hypothetical protein NEUTE1DRAFT_127796 [Neurospora tetrasperma FGSC 2508]|uniref:Myb-like domain-containing protein n=1 Tax=Neurospora tetrasperma (strain FGSC 2508 / ATCC MYA-4615 / P0657) TaxID=510951 RepID=F8MBB3_NEUT8|nr:uncharacterized protein NEUTE1DRAFT_127796 [Neurospora tetrasperma FGSC 2508]EGO61078.1 hypothetical protein NEUTE1DRAFT_127796 [Neurospora tetrasperma FGSC 2508]
MAPSGRKKGKEVDRSPTSILKHGDYTVSLTSWLAGGPVVLGKKPRRVIDLKVERDRKSETSDQSLVLARKDHDAAASDMEVGTSGSEGALTHTSRQRREPKGSSQPAVSSKPFLTYEEKRVEKFTIRPPPVVFNTPEDVPTGWLEAMLNQRKNGESSKAVSKKAISYEHNDSEDYEAGYDSPPHNKSKLLPKKSSSASRKASEIRIETKSSSKKGTRKVKVITADATDESDESLSDVESRRPMKTKKLERRSMTKERIKKKMHVEVSDEETADKVTTDIESSDIESTDVEPRSKPTSKKKPSTSSKKAGSSKVKVETRGRKGKRKVVVEASSEEEDSSVESMTEAEPSPLKKVKNKNRVTVTETTRKGKKKTITVESSDEADIAHVKSRSSQKGKKSEIRVKTSDKTKAKKVTFEPTDEPETTDDATTDAEPTPAKAQKGKGKSRTKAKKKIEVESPDPAETTNAVTTDDATQTEAETTDADTTVAEKPKGTPAAGKADNDWTPSQDASILSMKEGGEPWANIGSAIGRNKNEVKKRHQELVRLGAAQVNKGNQSKAHKTQNKKNKNNEAGPSHASVADETMGFRELPGFGFDADQDNSNNNDNNNNGDGWSGGGDQNNNTDNNGGGGEGAWGGGNQTDNNGGGDVGPGFDTPAWSADCTGGGDQDTNNNNNSNNDTNNNGFGDAGWGGGDQENNGGGNNKQSEDGMGWNTGGSDNNWRPPSAAGSTRSNKPPDNNTGWKSGPGSDQGWSVAPNPGYKPPSNSGWVPKNFVPPQGSKPPSNTAPPGSPDGWIYGSPTESERGRMAKRVEAWKGSISSPKEQGHWGMPDGGWHATPATDSRPREIAPDNTRGRSPAARSTSAKDWKQGLTRVDEEPDTGYDVWKKPPSNNGKPGSNAGRNSPGNFNNKPSGEQYGWNSGPDAVAGTGTGWGGGSDRVSTPSFKHPAKDEWTGGTKGNDKPPRTSKNNNRNNNKATGGNDSLTAFLQNPPPWGADCTGPWDSNKPANNKADKGDVQNALNIHMVRDLPGYNRDVAPMGLSGFPPVVEHYAPVPVPPVTPGPPGRYPSTPYSATPHPPGYLPKSEAQTTLLPLYNNSPPQAQYPSHDAPWNSTSWDTKPAVTTKPPGGPSSYQPGQRSAQCKTLSEEDLRSLYKQVVFSAMSSRQPLLQPKPDRDFTLRDCWVLISLSEQYDHSSASKEKWFELQAKFASATGRMVDVKLLRQKVKQGEKEAKVVEGWEDDEVGWRYKKKWEMETAW